MRGTMDAKNRQLLQTYQHDLIKDLDVRYIIDHLFTNGAINRNDFDHIFDIESRVERVQFLINILLQKGSNKSFEVLKDSLRKEYDWLWKKLDQPTDDSMLNDSFEDSLSRGDVPRLPVHYVRRIALEENVAEKLKQLTRHKLLVLHGMSGSGKTALVTSTLRSNPDLINASFNGAVFWLNLANCKTDDDVIAHQNKLYRKANSMYPAHSTSYMNSSISMSSIGSNGDSHSLSGYELSLSEYKDRLKTRFAEQHLKDALLVLDEVNDKKCVDAFDIGCKILITTRDSEVVAVFNPTIIKIENSLTEHETLELLASCIDVQVSQLPRQAKKLHDICKGSPFHIALIGAQLAENRERLLHDKSHWNYYLNLKKDFHLWLPRHQPNPMKTIELCLNSLNDNILPLFKKLNILPDNAKVSARVLSKLWNRDVTDVESIMKQLKSKSLIIESYNQDQKNYTYEIHDIIMNYLRTSTNKEEAKKMHSEFLKSYNYHNTPVEIVDDGYIAYYIGYHIYSTENFNNKWSLFNKLFLNLMFLGNKVRLTGPADVIHDLDKYERYIANNNELNRELIVHIKRYLSSHGIDLYRFPSTDIIQSVLQHESGGTLYVNASQAALEKCAKNELYFEFLHEQNVEEIKPSDIDVKEKITAVCFLGDYALVGTIKGVVKFFHLSTNKLKMELPCTDSPIKWIGACPVNPCIVAALSDDGNIKIWYIEDEEHHNGDVIQEEPEDAYNNNFPTNPVTIEPRLGHFRNCRWANNDVTLIVHTNHLVTLFNAKGDVTKIISNFEKDREVLCCVPCNKDRHVIVAARANGNYYLEVINLQTEERVMCFDENGPVIDILTILGTHKVLTMQTDSIHEHEFNCSNTLYQAQNCTKCGHKTVISAADVKEDVSFLSFAVNKSGTLLFVSTSDSRVICVDLKTNSRVFDLDNRRGNVVSMCVSETLDNFLPSSDVLLTGTGSVEMSAKVWYLDPSYVAQTTKNGKVRLTTKFDVSFVDSLSPPPSNSAPISGAHSTNVTPRRHQSFTHNEIEKKLLRPTMSLSLDRHAIKPLDLKGINCNGSGDEGCQPLLAVVDDMNNIQIMRGRKIITQIHPKTDDHITVVKISPCNQHIYYGLASGSVNQYTLRTKETETIMDVQSPVQYLNFVNRNLLMVSAKNRRLMAYRLTNGYWKSEMLQRGNTNLGSQEILNDMGGMNKRRIRSQSSDRLSNSGSDSSLSSKDRLCNTSSLVDCFWIENTGLITVENNASIKLWDQNMKFLTVLNAHSDMKVVCTAFEKNILVICNDKCRFQIFELKESEKLVLDPIQDVNLNSKIVSCDLTADGCTLAMGLDSGHVVVWYVPSKRQLHFLKHHKSKVHCVRFSPMPERLCQSGRAPCDDDAQPPLVLVTVASEIVWWNMTYLNMKKANSKPLLSWNVVSPLVSPNMRQPSSAGCPSPSSNFFFGDGLYNAQHCWKDIWKRKTCKEGSKKKEILACIKLYGVSAKKLCHDDKFSCFVTVDNPGYIHIMNVMRAQVRS